MFCIRNLFFTGSFLNQRDLVFWNKEEEEDEKEEGDVYRQHHDDHVIHDEVGRKKRENENEEEEEEERVTLEVVSFDRTATILVGNDKRNLRHFNRSTRCWKSHGEIGGYELSKEEDDEEEEEEKKEQAF